MDFDELIGNEKIKEDLKNILLNNTITHSYMFIGDKGIGKKLFAKKFAKGILCENNKICNKCKSCIEFENFNNPDYYEIGVKDGESSIKIDSIRQLQKKVQELPIVSDKKVYIIDESEYMTKEAQNCLLKTLEEPPKFVTLILIVSNESKILSTIQSRCIKIYFKNLKDNELKDFINKNMDVKAFTLNMFKACQGSIGKALSIYKNKDLYDELDKVFCNIEKLTLTDAITNLEVLYKNKEKIYDMLEYINIICMSKVKDNVKYADYISYIEDTKVRLMQNCNYDMCIDKMLFKIFK